MLALKLLFLLALANGAPVIARKLLGERLDFPVDGGMRFADGRPLLGPSKTVRGLISSVLVTSLGATAVGWTLQTGALVAVSSMLGDLLSSFIKRRLGLAPSAMALGLDQVPEALLPLLVCWGMLGLTVIDAVAVVGLFFISELVLSRVLYRLHIRERPY